MFRYVSCMMWMVSSIPNEMRNSVLSSCPSLSSSPAQICFLLNAIAQIKDSGERGRSLKMVGMVEGLG